MEEKANESIIHNISQELTMEDHITRFLSSNMKIKHYALENGIEYERFKRYLYQDSRYHKKSRGLSESKSSNSIQIIPVQIEDKVELEINGYQIRVNHIETLKKILQVMKEI